MTSDSLISVRQQIRYVKAYERAMAKKAVPKQRVKFRREKDAGSKKRAEEERNDDDVDLTTLPRLFVDGYNVIGFWLGIVETIAWFLLGKGQVLGWYATSLEAAASHDEAARLKGRRTNFAARRPDGDELPLFGRPPEPKRPPRAPWYERLIAERVSSSPRRPPKKPAPPPPAADASDDDLPPAANCAACRGKHCRHTCGRQTRMDGAY